MTEASQIATSPFVQLWGVAWNESLQFQKEKKPMANELPHILMVLEGWRTHCLGFYKLQPQDAFQLGLLMPWRTEMNLRC